MAALQIPAGYWTTPGRDEFGLPCLTLHHEHYGVLSDHDCRADAIYAALEHADELADEASAEARAVAENAYDAALDSIHALIAGLIVSYLPGDDVARGEQRAVREALIAIGSLGMGSASPVAVGKAA
jgi:hypothetical protein